MAISQEFFDLERQTVYDFNEMCVETDYPIRAICQAIKKIIGPIQDRKKLANVHWGTEELIKNLEHGDQLCDRLVFVRRELGGIAVETVNKVGIEKEDSQTNGYGIQILQEVFGDDYSAIVEEGVYRGYLFIKHDEPV